MARIRRGVRRLRVVAAAAGPSGQPALPSVNSWAPRESDDAIPVPRWRWVAQRVFANRARDPR